MKRVSSQHLIASVPRIRIVDRVGIDVPPVTGIPIRVDGPDFVQNVAHATVR